MRIVWKQKKTVQAGDAPFAALGIERCYLKQIRAVEDVGRTTRKVHHHTGVEMHLIREGYQTYEIEGRTVRVEAGQCLLIPPLMPHCVIGEGAETVKYSLTFGFFAEDALSLYHGLLPGAIWDNLEQVEVERGEGLPFGDRIVGIRVWETILRLLRLMSLREEKETAEGDREGDARYWLAVQYIEDNRRRALTVDEVATYCCISPKQLGRIFLAESGRTVAAYIRGVRCREIERMLAETDLGLRQISDAMDFQNEYYFNSFFTRHAGMTPGAYRRSIRKEG